MVSRDWTRRWGQFLPDGSVPLVQGGIDLFTITGGASLLRARTTLELYVGIVSSSGSLINFQVAEVVTAAMGLIMYDSASPPAASATPLTDFADPAGSSGWLQWEYMRPTVTYFKESDVETAVVTYRCDPLTIDTQARRRTTVGNVPSVWLAWELDDQSGLINTVTSGTTYALGARYMQESLIYTL